MKKSKKTNHETCKHTVGDSYAITLSDNDGLYISDKCPKCRNEIKDYYELANRYNKSTEKDEPFPDNE